LAGLHRAVVGNAFLRSADAEAQLAIGGAPHARNRVPARRHDAQLSGRIEEDGVGGAVGGHLDRLADDLGPGRPTLGHNGRREKDRDRQSKADTCDTTAFHDQSSLAIRGPSGNYAGLFE
jgi:hypothetical protein